MTKFVWEIPDKTAIIPGAYAAHLCLHFVP